MEGVSGMAEPIDKSRVLDVKPLRCLVPIFPDGSGAPPFVCAPPFGPFPPGCSPFFPFAGQGSQAPPDLNQRNFDQMPAPLRSFRTPETHTANGGAGSSRDTPKDSASRGRGSSSTKRKLKNQDGVADGGKGLSADIIGFSLTERDDGNTEVVKNVLMRFDATRRRLSQLEDAKESPTGLIRRADLKAGNILLSKGVRTNMRKRIGAVPGVEIGDIFFFRMELCVVGLHAPSMAGIDYMSLKGDSEEEPVAVSIVSSGGYDDEAEDADVLVYSGQGGNVNKKDRQAADQKLERGNLALERSLHRGNVVRVTRGVKDGINPNSRVYMYDGLYAIQESWVEKGKSGCNVFKYKLVRVPGQPASFSVWKSIQKWKEGFSSRDGIILQDLTSGAESLPVSLVNEIDDEKGPDYFTYFPTVKYSRSFKLVEPSFSCNCRNACQPGNLNCSCIRKNEGDFPYTAGVLVSRKSMIHECGPSCPCGSTCKSRVSQNGLKVRLEVFKTGDKGWGLRSWDPIRAGTFICEYAGEVIDKNNLGQDKEHGENYEYVFDTSRIYESFKWNFEPELIEEDSSSAPTEDFNIPCSLVISAKRFGNVSRFMNHGCSPNVFWQPLIYEHNNESFVHIAFYAKSHIPPMTELTFDYGIVQAEGDGEAKGRKKCLCGSPQCRDYFYG